MRKMRKVRIMGILRILRICGEEWTYQGERILALLKQKNLIRREGATKNGRWIVIG